MQTLKDHTILIVEDDPVLGDLARRQLSYFGLGCIVVSSGEEAIKQDFEMIQLILMDIGLPGMDGCHTALIIRENELRENRRRIPIIALTAFSDKDRYFLAGMDDFIQKPILIPVLKEMLEKWLTVTPKALQEGFIDSSCDT